MPQIGIPRRGYSDYSRHSDNVRQQLFATVLIGARLELEFGIDARDTH